ncbi:MAG: ABC transporter permease [Pseudomonadota bacterium]
MGSGPAPAPARARGWRWLSAVLGLLVLGPVFAGLIGVILPAFGYLPPLGARGLTLDIITTLVDEPGFWRSVLVSGVTGLVATALSVVLTASILAATFGSAVLRLVERVLAPILSVPHAAAALGFVFLFAPSGFVLRLISPSLTGWTAPPDLLLIQDPWGLALIAALTIKETPFLFLMALAALVQVRAQEHVALARTLGYGRLAAFVFAVWPLLYRQLRLPVLAVLAFATSVVDMALILGPTRPPTLGVRIISWLQSADLNGWLLGSAAALAMFVLVALVIAVWLLCEKGVGALFKLISASGQRWPRDRTLRFALLVFAGVGVLVTFLGFGGLVVQSVAGFWPFPDVAPQSVSLSSWRTRLPMAGDVLRQTLIVAMGATALALPVAVAFLEAERRGVRVWWLIYTPLIVPQVAFVFGLDILAISAGITPGLGAVTLTHALFALPYALIALSGPWAALDPRFEAIAASLGKGPLTRLVRVRLALLAQPLAVAAALCVAVSVGLYVPTQVIGGGRVTTVTTEAVAASASGDRRLIGLFATLQLVLPFIAFTVARGVPRLAKAARGLFRHTGAAVVRQRP